MNSWPMIRLAPRRTPLPRSAPRCSIPTWGVVDPMVTPAGKRIFLGTRWHEDEIYAELIRRGWPHLTYRAIRDDGTALWPTTGGSSASRPSAPSSARRSLICSTRTIQREWAETSSSATGSHGSTPCPPVPGASGVDLASSKSERSDYTAAVEVVEDVADDTLYFVGAFAARLDEGHRRWLTGQDDDGTLRRDGGEQPAWTRACCGRSSFSRPGFCGAIGLPRGATPAKRPQHRGDPAPEHVRPGGARSRPVCRPDRSIPTRTR